MEIIDMATIFIKDKICLGVCLAYDCNSENFVFEKKISFNILISKRRTI